MFPKLNTLKDKRYDMGTIDYIAMEQLLVIPETGFER
jgi:hypothetical protein